MDLSEIVIAAIGGGLGALAGALIGGLIPRKEGSTGLGLGGIVTIILVIVGAQFAPPFIEPHVGPHVRAALGDDVGSDVDALFAENEIFQALSEADPAAHERMRSRVEQAYGQGGIAAARDIAFQEGYELGQQAVIRFGPRAPDETLLAMQHTTLGVARGLRQEPRLCYAMLYSAVTPQNVPMEDVSAAGNHPAAAGLQTMLSDLIRAAGPEVIAYDADRVAQAMGDVQLHMLENLSQEQLRYFTGYAPQTDVEYLQACDTMIDLLEFQLNHEYAADMVRAGLSAG